MRSDRLRRSVRIALVTLAIATSVHLLVAGQPVVPRFYPDDPLRFDNDRVVDVRGAGEIKLGDYYDFIENVFLSPGDRRAIRAVNVNTLDEVPDSSWFTNRMGTRDLSLDALVTGPDRPVTFSDRWTIVRGKNRGFHPGFRAIDRSDPSGTVYQLEVDPPAHPEMASGAEVVGAAFYHAFGYNTVDVYLTEFDPAQLEIDPAATIRDANGRRPFTRRDLEDILQNAARQPNGRIRVTAERFPEEDEMGRFEYHGTRPDDPNDIHPHEHRRELRGSRVFAAWLNHDDSRALNTLVLRHREEKRRFFKYYIVDFGSLLGSATRFADTAQSGREYALAVRPSLLTFLSFGLYVRPWLRQPPPSDLPAVGRFTGDGFDPERWVAEYPKVAYENMRADDAFWGARIVAAFDESRIRAIVSKGQYSDPRVADELTRALLARRQRILDVWLTAVNPIVNAALSRDGVLTFENAAVTHGVGGLPEGYLLQWSRFHNSRDAHAPAGAPTLVTSPQAVMPAAEALAGADYISVSVRTIHPGFPDWRPVQLYFRATADGWEWVGLDRGLDPEGGPASR